MMVGPVTFLTKNLTNKMKHFLLPCTPDSATMPCIQEDVGEE
jgi:hypothetical protein